MITITIEDLLHSRLPDEYYQATYHIYIVRDGATMLYVGKAERQSVYERLLQHLAANTASDFYSQVSGPSELGQFIRANAPQSNHWHVDMLTLDECRHFAKPSARRISITQAERTLIQAYLPLLNRTHVSRRPTPPSDDTQTQVSAQAEKDNLIPESIPSSSQVLPEYAAEFLASTSESPKTQETYRFALIRFQHFAEDEALASPQVPLQPDKLHQEVLAHFMVWLQNKDLKNNTMRTFIAAVKQYLLWLQDDNRLPGQLRVDEIYRYLEKKAGPHLRSIPQERRQADYAVGRLLNYYAQLLEIPLPNTPRGRRQKLAYLRNQAVMLTLYSTAGRAGEVAALTRGQVEDGQAQLAEIAGQGGRKRLVYFTPEAQKAVQAYLAARADSEASRLVTHELVSQHGALFVRHDRDTLTAISTKTIWQIVHEAALAVFGSDAEGRPLKRVGPHDFRHLRAQHLYDNDMPIDMIQAILGHSSIVTTRNIYASRTSAEKLIRGLEKYGRDPTEVAKGE